MKLCYLADIRFPSERAHSAQISHMCNALSLHFEGVDLYVNNRGHLDISEVENMYGSKNSYSVYRVPRFLPVMKSRLLYTLGTLIYFLTFLLLLIKRGERYTFYFSRSEMFIYLLSFVKPKDSLVWESHDLKNNFFARKVIEKNIKVVVTAKALKAKYEKKTRKKNILLAPNAISRNFLDSTINKNSARDRFGLDPHSIVVMYIGGLDSWKGVDVFLEASKKNLQIVFCVIGGSCEEVKKYRQCYPNVQFFGSRPYSELPINQQAADILVIPNTAKNQVSAQYTSPLKYFAHATSGVPIVISDLPSMRSLPGSEACYFFKPDDVESLSAILKKVLKEYDQAVSSAANLRSISKNFTWENRAALLVRFMLGKD